MTPTERRGYGEQAHWRPRAPRFALLPLATSWLASAVALFAAAAVVPGAEIADFGGALVTAALVGLLNGLLPPVVAALRLPYTVAAGFVLVLVLDALMLLAASQIDDRAIQVSSLWAALATAIVAAAVSVAVEVVSGFGRDDQSTIRLLQRIARRQGTIESTDVPGLVFLEIDGLALPVLRRAMRDGNAPTLARWLEDGTHELFEWETDLSSQTGASQAGILLGSNDDIPAFRWVEKERGRLVVASAPADCEEIERRHAGRGLLSGGGASRGNLLSGEADEVILTVSRLSAEKRANPGYRAFFANGSNVTRVLVLAGWEVVLEVVAALRARRRDVRPRGHRGGHYPLVRAALCVVVRDLIVYGVLTDMMRGRPVVYATFSSYDEVAHHSGLERADTLEALRKLDAQLGRIAAAARFAARPYHLVALSDHGQTQGATFRQRNGQGLDDLVAAAMGRDVVAGIGGGDEHQAAVGQAVGEAIGRPVTRKPKGADVSGLDVVVLGSGNLGLVYLMDEPRRLTLEQIDARHPRLVSTLRAHPHVGFVLVRSEDDGTVVLGARGARYLRDDRVEGDDPLAPFSPRAADHLRRTDRFPHAADILVNSFYDPALEQGCAFEELISFHGGMGGPQTQPFILAPRALPRPDEPIVGAAAVHDLLRGWRVALQGDWPVRAAEPAASARPPASSPLSEGDEAGQPLGAPHRRR